MKPVGALALITALCGCEKAAPEYLAEARKALTEIRYDEAVSAAEAGLGRDPTPTVSWGLELVKLEAHARAGNGAQAKQQIERLDQLFPDRVPATEYTATAHQLQSAGEGVAAIEVLDLGAKRHPYDGLIQWMIARFGSHDADPAEIEMLRSLGYIE